MKDAGLNPVSWKKKKFTHKVEYYYISISTGSINTKQKLRSEVALLGELDCTALHAVGYMLCCLEQYDQGFITAKEETEVYTCLLLCLKRFLL